MPKNDPTLAILPYEIKMGARPGRISLDRLIWPLGQPAHMQGKCLRDLGRDDHLIVFARRTLHYRPSFGTRAKVSILVMEPAAIHSKHLRKLRWSYRRFHRVLIFNEDLLTRIPNGVFLPFGTTWVPEWRELDLGKSRMCSLIASSKRSQEGHKLRHGTAEWIRREGIDIDVIGAAYQPFTNKAEGLAPYRYSIVIENVRERNYFTEKLIDTVLCKSVPIYWGCPNIADFLETEGMILCNSAEDIRKAVLEMSEQDYAMRLPALTAMQSQADKWGDLYQRAATAVLKSD